MHKFNKTSRLQLQFCSNKQTAESLLQGRDIKILHSARHKINSLNFLFRKKNMQILK